MSAGSLVVLFLVASFVVIGTDAYHYNITTILKPGGTDQEGRLSIMLKGTNYQRLIVNLGDFGTPLPSGMVRSVGADVDDIPAHEVFSVHFAWFDYTHSDWDRKGVESILLDRVIVDPEYLKDSPAERSKYTQAFCPDATDFPTKSWGFIVLQPC